MRKQLVLAAGALLLGGVLQPSQAAVVPPITRIIADQANASVTEARWRGYHYGWRHHRRWGHYGWGPRYGYWGPRYGYWRPRPYWAYRPYPYYGYGGVGYW